MLTIKGFEDFIILVFDVSLDVMRITGDSHNILIPQERMPQRQHKRKGELTAQQRAEIVSMYQGGMGPTAIANQMKRSVNTIKSVIRIFGQRETFESKSRSGRPPKAGPRELKRLEEYIRKYPQATPQEIAKNAHVGVQWRQIY